MVNRHSAVISVSVWVHAAVTVCHSVAHVGAGVWMPLPAMAYIWLVIIIGPIAGWWLVRSGRVCTGSCVVAVCMLGAFLFGALNHFVWPGADHIDSIAAGLWRGPFQATAVLLALTEAGGALAGLQGGWACLHERSTR